MQDYVNGSKIRIKILLTQL